MPWLYRIMWTMAIIFFILALTVFSIWIVLIGAVLYAVYRCYLYFVHKKGLGSKGRTRQSGRVFYKVYTNYGGTAQPRGYNSSKGYANGEIIDMPVEEVIPDSKNLGSKEK